MILNETEIERSLQLSRQRVWSGAIPLVPASLRLAINSLLTQEETFFGLNPGEILAVLRKRDNEGIREILEKTETETFAFALRDALS